MVVGVKGGVAGASKAREGVGEQEAEKEDRCAKKTTSALSLAGCAWRRRSEGPLRLQAEAAAAASEVGVGAREGGWKEERNDGGKVLERSDGSVDGRFSGVARVLRCSGRFAQSVREKGEQEKGREREGKGREEGERNRENQWTDNWKKAPQLSTAKESNNSK